MKITKRELLKIIQEETVGVEDVSKTADAFAGGEVEEEIFVDTDAEALLNQNTDPGEVTDIEIIPERARLKRQLRRIIEQEQLSLFDKTAATDLKAAAPAAAPAAPAPQKSARERGGEEAMAGFLLAVSDEGRKEALAKFTKATGDKPWEVVTGMVDSMCGMVSSWDGWGSAQGAANKACQIGGRVVAAPTFGVGKVAMNGLALALSMIPTDMLNDFAADSYPDTIAGKIALKKKTARLKAEKEAEAAKGEAMKESLRRIVRKELGTTTLNESITDMMPVEAAVVRMAESAAELFTETFGQMDPEDAGFVDITQEEFRAEAAKAAPRIIQLVTRALNGALEQAEMEFHRGDFE